MGFYFPGSKSLGVLGFASVMLGEAFFQVGCFTDIDFCGVLLAGEDVDEEHVLFLRSAELQLQRGAESLLIRVFVCRGFAGAFFRAILEMALKKGWLGRPG